jgi:hypothetical protein
MFPYQPSRQSLFTFHPCSDVHCHISRRWMDEAEKGRKEKIDKKHKIIFV